MKIVWRQGIAHAVIEVCLENVPDRVNSLMEVLQQACLHKVPIDPEDTNNLLQMVRELQLSTEQAGHISMQRATGQIPTE